MSYEQWHRQTREADSASGCVTALVVALLLLALMVLDYYCFSSP